MRRIIWTLTAAVLIMGLGSQDKANAADKLQITVSATIEVLSVDWNGAGDVAGKSWNPVFSNYGTTETSVTYTVHNRNTYAQDISVSASTAGANWTLGATSGANIAVLTVGTDSIHAGPKVFNAVAGGGSQGFTLALKAPASGNTASGNIVVTATATKD